MSKFYSEVLSKSLSGGAAASHRGEPRKLPKPPSLEELRGNLSLTPIPATPIATAPTGPTPIAPAPPPETPPSLEAVLAELDAAPVERSRGKVIDATRMEHGHSATQNEIYWYLWRTGKPVSGSRSKFVKAGYAQIQNAVSVDRSNVQDAIRELQKKFSIAVVRPGTTGSATVYEVFCCDEIMEKRAAKGLLWAFRYGTRRADLLDNPDLAPTGLAPTPSTPTPSTPTVSAPLTPTASPPVGATPTVPIGVTPILLVKSKSEGESSSSSSLDPRPLQDAIEEVARRSRLKRHLEIDDIAGRTLEEVRARAGATVDETAYLFVRKLLDVQENKGLYNPVGMLLDKPDLWLTPRTLGKLRDARAAEEAEHERIRKENEEWEAAAQSATGR